MGNKTNALVFKITITSVFAALCFISLFLRIPIPSPVGKPYIHLGNLIVILVSLLFGGPIGALAGAIGMGLFDIVDGYGIWTIKTVVLKLLMGLICGFVYYRLSKNKNKEVNISLRTLILSVFFVLLGLISLILAIVNHSVITIGNKDIVITWPIYTFSLLIGALLITSVFLMKGKNYDYKVATYATSIAMIANVFGEFIGKLIKTLLEGQGLKVSIISCIASLPATMMNSVITIIIVMMVYPILKKTIEERNNIGDENEF